MENRLIAKLEKIYKKLLIYLIIVIFIFTFLSIYVFCFSKIIPCEQFFIHQSRHWTLNKYEKVKSAKEKFFTCK